MQEQRRRDVRYAIRFPAQVIIGKRSMSLVTADVSYGGVFLRTDAPPPLHQLVRVRLVLPVGDHAITAHGMTVRIISASNPSGYEPGFGVQFYGLDPITRDSWEAFVRHVEHRYPPAADQVPLRLPRGFTPEPIRKRVQRHTAVLKLEPVTQRELEELHARAVKTRGLFVPTFAEVKAGSRVVIYIQHPSSGQPFLIEATVVDRVSSPPAPVAGVGVQLPSMDARFEEDFADFVRAGILIDEEVVKD